MLAETALYYGLNFPVLEGTPYYLTYKVRNILVISDVRIWHDFHVLYIF